MDKQRKQEDFMEMIKRLQARAAGVGEFKFTTIYPGDEDDDEKKTVRAGVIGIKHGS